MGMIVSFKKIRKLYKKYYIQPPKNTYTLDL
jgi:hypothetical protein